MGRWKTINAMDERVTTQQLSDAVRRARKVQVMLAVGGMGAFLLALVGGSLQSRGLAWLGIVGFAVCLIGLLIVGVRTWWKGPR